MSRKIVWMFVAACLIAALPAAAQSASMKTRVWTETAALATLLSDVQTNVTLSGSAWRTIANEANARANKVYARTSGNKAARGLATELRMHVREMHKAAMKGDAAEAKRHAREALPFAYQLIDWAAS